MRVRRVEEDPATTTASPSIDSGRSASIRPNDGEVHRDAQIRTAAGIPRRSTARITRRSHREGRQRSDETAALHDRDEVVGRQHPVLGVLPPHQRLGADDPPRSREPRLRLVVDHPARRRRSRVAALPGQLEAAYRGCRRPLATSYQLSTPWPALPASYIAMSARFMERGPTSVPLHRRQQRCRCFPAILQRHALGPRATARRARLRISCASATACHWSTSRTWEQRDGVLVASEPADRHACSSERTPGGCAGQPQSQHGFVAGVVPECVVDVLEPVEVHQEDADQGVAALHDIVKSASSSRSGNTLTRFGRPVSASVSASRRLASGVRAGALHREQRQREQRDHRERRVDGQHRPAAPGQAGRPRSPSGA